MQPPDLPNKAAAQVGISWKGADGTTGDVTISGPTPHTHWMGFRRCSGRDGGAEGDRTPDPDTASGVVISLVSIDLLDRHLCE